MSESDHLLSTPQLAERLGVAEITLKTWRCRGEGPRFVRVGRCVRYRLVDVDRWLDANAVGGVA